MNSALNMPFHSAGERPTVGIHQRLLVRAAANAFEAV